MNFFSHFLIDHKPDAPAYNVALIMPDLLRNFTPKSCKFNFQEALDELKKSSHPDTNLIQFFEGCLQHINRDKAFHSSAFFKKTYDNLRDEWKSICANYQIPKFWFSLHVLIEIMLDKYYIDNQLEKLTLFYSQLKSQRITVEKALRFLEHPNHELFLERYDRFCEVQYLFHYQQIDRIAFALHRIFIQVGIPTDWYEKFEPMIVADISQLYQGWIEQLEPLGLNEIQGDNEGAQ